MEMSARILGGFPPEAGDRIRSLEVDHRSVEMLHGEIEVLGIGGQQRPHRLPILGLDG